jgi:hypothetical protein
MNKIIIYLSFMLLLITTMNCTKGNKAGDETQKAAVLMAILEGASPTKDKCVTAVGIMNQCVGTGYNNQYNPANMCSSANLKTEADYDTLISCVSDRVNITNCNFPQNRQGNAANASTNIFAKSFGEGKDSCNVNGIIVSDWYTITVPSF